MIYYLTGTGNSRWAAQLLADHLHDTAEDAAPALKSGLAPSLHSENRGSLSVPPTAGRSPMSLPICCAAPALMAAEKPISSSPAGMISVRPGPACASSAGSWAWNTAACGRW